MVVVTAAGTFSAQDIIGWDHVTEMNRFNFRSGKTRFREAVIRSHIADEPKSYAAFLAVSEVNYKSI